MCDQELPEKIEAILQKPAADRSFEDTECLNSWVSENSKHMKSRLSYLDLSDLLFTSASLWTKDDYGRVAEWLNAPERKQQFARRIRSFLLKKSPFDLPDKDEIASSAQEFVHYLFDKRTKDPEDSRIVIDAFEPTRANGKMVGLYGYISILLGYWLHERLDQLFKELREVPFDESPDDQGRNRSFDDLLRDDYSPSRVITEDKLWRPDEQNQDEINSTSDLKTKNSQAKGVSIALRYQGNHLQNPEDELIREQLKTQLVRAIDSLPDEYRILLLLQYTQELSGEEIADQLSISHELVRKRIRKAKKILREKHFYLSH